MLTNTEQSLLDGVNDIHKLLTTKKVYVRLQGQIYNRFKSSYSDFIDNQTCNLFFDSNKSIAVYFPNKIFSKIQEEFIDEGTTVTINGNVTVYGYYKTRDNEIILVSPILQIICTSYTVDEILEEKIYEENLIPKALPSKSNIKNIALITRLNSDAHKDFIKEFTSDVLKKVFIYDSKMEGSNAINEIVECITQANSDPNFNVICIVRGGGEKHHIDSIFNSNEICAAIKRCSKPVLIGIGHAQNITNADKVSDSPIVNGEKYYFTSPSILGSYINQLYSQPQTQNTYRQHKNYSKNSHQSSTSDLVYIFVIICLLAFIGFKCN